MKQTITIEQLNELSDKEKEKLLEWWKQRTESRQLSGYSLDFHGLPDGLVVYADRKTLESGIVFGHNNQLPLLSIGQMVEFLDEHAPMFWSIKHQEFTQKNEQFGWSIEDYGVYGDYVDDIELCDALFEAVKEVLEQ